MTINKFQRSTFQPRSLILDSLQHIKHFFSEITWPIELKFHINTPYARSNCSGHMTKMAIKPIYGKTFLNIFSGTIRQMAWDLVWSIGDMGRTRFAQIMHLR